jgi:hypothetical protein
MEAVWSITAIYSGPLCRATRSSRNSGGYNEVMNVLDEMYSWGKRRYLVAVVAGLGWLVLSGVPTDIIDTPLFKRMTPVEW